MIDKRKKVDLPRQSSVLQSILNRRPSHSDPLGSYTGIPEDPYTEPVQDADDL